MERLDGPDLLTRLGKRPWVIPATGRLLGELHARLHGIEAPAILPDLRTALGELLASGSELIPPELAAKAQSALAELPDGGALCHGDFHPGNVLLTDAGPRVIDWAGACRGDPLADVCRTLLLIEMAALPAEAPMLVRRLNRVGRRLLVRSYLAAYGTTDAAQLERWRQVLLITRLAEGIDAERRSLLELIDHPPVTR
jgi:aminoglycoside phosphotransferase (APT) family kinase protein